MSFPRYGFGESALGPTTSQKSRTHTDRFRAMVGCRKSAIDPTGVKGLLQVWPARLGSSQDVSQLLLVTQCLCVANVVQAPGDGGVAQGLEAFSRRITVVFLNPGRLYLLFSQPKWSEHHIPNSAIQISQGGIAGWWSANNGPNAGHCSGHCTVHNCQRSVIDPRIGRSLVHENRKLVHGGGPSDRDEYNLARRTCVPVDLHSESLLHSDSRLSKSHFE